MPSLSALVLMHLVCNQIATERVLSGPEALECSANFERVKIALHPDWDFARFSALPPSDRARISVEAYAHYVAWKAANPEELARLQQLARLAAAAE